MIFLKDNSLSSVIVTSLRDKSLTGPKIIKEVTNKKGVTRQAVYVILRDLLNKNVITKKHTLYSLNRLWLKDIYQFAEKQLTSLERKDTENIFDLSDGDKIIYNFKSPKLMNNYWGHIFDTLLEAQDLNQPIIIYHPHDWFIYDSKHTEEFFLNRIKSKKGRCFFSIGGNSYTDKLFQKKWREETFQINCGNFYDFGNNYYLNILGDFLFEVFVDKKFALEIDNIYKSNKDETVIGSKIQKLAAKSYKTKLVFSRNRKKAMRLSKKISKDFYSHSVI